MQEIVSIRDANQHLSRYLERVEQRTEIIITRRGKPIVRVGGGHLQSGSVFQHGRFVSLRRIVGG